MHCTCTAHALHANCTYIAYAEYTAYTLHSIAISIAIGIAISHADLNR